MAAYAAVVSLMNTLDNIRNHPCLSSCLDNDQIETLAEKLHSMLPGFNSDGSSSRSKDSQKTIPKMAAYAAVVSLMNTLDNIRNLSRLSSCLDNDQIETLAENLHSLLPGFNPDGSSSSREIDDLEQIKNHSIESLHEKAALLLDFIETCNPRGVIESQIASVAHAAEDVIESHIADYLLAEDDSSSFRYSRKDHANYLDWVKLPRMTKEMVMEVESERGLEEHPRLDNHGETSSSRFLNQLKQMVIVKIPSFLLDLRKMRKQYSMPAAPSRSINRGKTTEVGRNSDLVQLLDWLTGHQSNRQIISITGMGGIGKTTLARIVYENSLIKQHFDVCVWVTISQEFNVKGILNESLSCLGESLSELDNITKDALGERLHKILFGRRYLLILDDMWSVEAWNEISLFFPENNNQSRVIVTTRQSSVANHFGSLGLAMSFLNDDESWMLFCEKAFEKQGCPLELEEIGRTIVKKCRGLPLSLVVIGELLKRSSRAKEYWENVARDVSKFLNSEAESHSMDILFLSYSHLPACLKPCFLHLGIFPEDHEIRVSLLVKLWVAEGFIKPNKDQILEEVAEGYIKDLVERNLILVRTFKMDGKTKSFSVHDLLRDLCLRIAVKEEFCCVKRPLHTPGDIDKQRRIVISGNTHTLRSTSVARSLICRKPAKLSLKSKLLRVLITVNSDSTDAALEQVNLRFFDCQFETTSSECLYELPLSISRLWNLQTLIMTKGTPEVVAPFGIWEMRQLRHLKLNMVTLPSPTPSYKRRILGNLQTLQTVLNFECSEEVCKRIPNIRKLCILYDNDHWRRHSHNIGNLQKLESLKCSFYHPSWDDFLENLKFPTSLKKLILENCGLQWSELKAVGSLPNLEVFKLYSVATTEPVWSPADGEFQCLQFLGIYGCSNLISWNTDESHFPVLKKLVLERLWKLEEIPPSIGEIPTLERIFVHDCSISAAISAVGIQKEQESLENHSLKVEVDFSMTTDLLKFRKMLEKEP